VDWPEFLVGARLGRWSLDLGRQPRRTGAGVTGALILGATAPSFPALTLRRTAPFVWGGWLGKIAPAGLLWRMGRTSTQLITYDTPSGEEGRTTEPWFVEWLITFRHTDWLRSTVHAGALAISRDGSLFPDLLQVMFPVIGVTMNEMERGPVTDRLFSLQLEARWRRAPWPLLPRSAGRLYWEYGGEDFIPNRHVNVLPQISAPGSVLGVELLEPRWDLGVEYVDLSHPSVLWYSNSDFSSGYAHEGTVLGHPLGGSGRALSGRVRWRPAGPDWELELALAEARWGVVNQTPGEAERRTLGLSFARTAPPVLWSLALRIHDEWTAGYASGTDGALGPETGMRWWQAVLTVAR
jgi:hypothetical protein